ncbi:MAG: mannose-1-phosphate guanylyltransferase [Minisyncoccia bacterium]
MKIVVLAGGSGQRLWPVSRKNNPKQFISILGNKSLIKLTVERLLKVFNKKDILIVLNKKLLKEAKKQLPYLSNSNFIIEPQKISTTAAIGLAVYNIYKKNPQEIIVTMASDHYIGNDQEFLNSLKHLFKFIKQNPQSICLFGIKPTYPETGYGYIETTKNFKLIDDKKFLKVKKFIEKPNLNLAKKIYSLSSFFWNGSYFAFRADYMVNLFKNFIPKSHNIFLKILKGQNKAFNFIDSRPFEYSIIQNIKNNIFVLPVNFEWADVGHWASVKEIQSKKSDENVVLGLHHYLNTKNCLLYNYSNRFLTTIGIKNILIIQVEDGVLVCHKDFAQDVKKMVEEISKKSYFKKFL